MNNTTNNEIIVVINDKDNFDNDNVNVSNMISNAMFNYQIIIKYNINIQIYQISYQL